MRPSYQMSMDGGAMPVAVLMGDEWVQIGVLKEIEYQEDDSEFSIMDSPFSRWRDPESQLVLEVKPPGITGMAVMQAIYTMNEQRWTQKSWTDEMESRDL